MKKITIYTDGACKGNPGPGGWAAILLYKDSTKEIFGSEEHTTNNRMELIAAIEAVKSLKEPCEIDIYTDSIYVKDGITSWIDGWKKNGWKTSAKKPVKNVELWQELDQIAQKHLISWRWVKGHSGDYYNDLADGLAVKACEAIIAKSKAIL